MLAPVQYFAIAGGLLVICVFAAIQVLASRFDKRNLVILLGLFSVVDGLVMISLKLMNLLPDNSNWTYLPLIVTTWTMVQVAGQISGIMRSSMIADVVDESEFKTGVRQEGVFFSALSFSGKAVSALGTMIGGAILSFVDFPVGATVQEVPAEIIFNLGLINGPILQVFFLVPFIVYTRYKLNRSEHQKVRDALLIKRKLVLST